MAIPGITYREIKQSSLTHTEMDNNFRSLFYSSSITDGGDTLILHYDTAALDSVSIPLNAGTGGVTIQGNVDNRVLTATGGAAIQGESNFTFDGDVLTIAGRVDLNDGDKNSFIGGEAGESISGTLESVGIGFGSSTNLTGDYNTAIGVTSLRNALASSQTVAIGHSSLNNLNSGNQNVSIGSNSGQNLTSGTGNVHLGFAAGPGSSTAESNKLYINNAASNTPLVLGDFSTGHVSFNSTVSASVFSGSYYGDGSNLTGLTAAAEWDGTLDGDAEITGSLIVSGTAVTVDFTNVESISGSIFSGSFVGDGSGLTGIQADTFPYTGSAEITGSLTVTGSFIVSGSNPNIELKAEVDIDQNITIRNGNTDGFTPQNIGIGQNALAIGGSCTFSNGFIQRSTLNIGIGRNVLGGRRYSQYSTSTGRYDNSSQSKFCYNTAVGHYSQADNCIIGTSNTSIGAYSLHHGGIGYNTAVGAFTMQNCNRRAQQSTAVGFSALRNTDCGTGNAAYGSYSLNALNNGSHNIGLGYQALRYLKADTSGTGNTIQYTNLPQNNTAVGAKAGICTTNGSANVYIGSCAGQSIPTVESNKLYINNAASANPLILGDFSTGHVTINSTVSASMFSGSFVGNGSELTGVEWDGTRNGDAEITGSLIVSGSSVTVDLTNTLTVSGSIFSGSFVGDGSGLTGISSEWDGTRNGDSEITGSLIVSGALDVSNTITLGSTGYPGSPGVELIHFHSSSLSGTHTIFDFAIGGSGYTGFKADYTLNTESEDEKKVGTLLGAWDQAGGETLNDAHTVATGNILGTSFSIDSDGSNALLELDASTGTYNVNMLITAFKRQV